MSCSEPVNAARPLYNSGLATADMFWRFAFVVVMVLECIPFWIFRYFPSQDGPSHLYNAAVLVNYRTEPIYREFFRLTPWQPAGNLLTQFILAGLLELASPGVAEKLLLTGYVVLLFLSLRYFLGALTPYADHFAVFAGILAPNAFLYLGFWNFCYSIGVLLLILGYYARQKGQWTLRSLTLLGVFGVVLYETHAVSWIICIVAIGLLGLPEVLAVVFERERRRNGAILKAIRQSALPVCSLLPPGIFMLIHLKHSQVEATHGRPDGLHTLLWDVYSLPFLHTLPLPGTKFSKAVAAALLCGMLCVIVTAIRRHRYDWRSTALLGVSLTCAALAIAGPDRVGTGSYIHVRVVLYVCVFFLAWLAAQSWPRVALHMLSSVFVALAVTALAASLPTYSFWNRALPDFVAVCRNIRPRSTVLTLNVSPLPRPPVDPDLHAVDLLSSAGIIDLLDYEALTDYFSTEFRADRSPIPALGGFTQLLETMPVQINIPRYERATGTHVEYVLVEAGPSSGASQEQYLEQKLYGNQLAAYRLVASGKNGAPRLYERIATPLNLARGGL